MKSHDLTREQIETLMAGVQRGRSYLRRLEERMCANGFTGAGDLATLVVDPHNAVDRLWVRLHYLNCEKTKPESTLSGGGGR